MRRLKEKHTPDLTSYNCLMTGLARLGDADGALKVFEEMQVEADDVSYKLVWAAHERQGNAIKAGLWLRRMLKHGFVPGLGPYAWMIQRHGAFNESLLRAQELRGSRGRRLAAADAGGSLCAQRVELQQLHPGLWGEQRCAASSGPHVVSYIFILSNYYYYFHLLLLLLCFCNLDRSYLRAC